MANDNIFSISFKSYYDSYTKKIDQFAVAWLNEVAGEVCSTTKKLSRGDTGRTKTSYQYAVDKTAKSAIIGSSYMNAIWEEFGTGEYAVNGDGRKGYWVYVVGSKGSVYRPAKYKKSYTLEEAKKIMAILRKKGLEAYYTNGKRPNYPLQRAFLKNSNKIEQALIERLKIKMKGERLEGIDIDLD